MYDMFDRAIYCTPKSIGQKFCKNGHPIDWHWTQCPFCKEGGDNDGKEQKSDDCSVSD
jgi:hypothetical protein